jgi:hypothetical protein
LEKPPLETIPEGLIPPSNKSVQSNSGWRQAESDVPPEVDTQVNRSQDAGSTSSNAAKRWEKDGRYRW